MRTAPFLLAISMALPSFSPGLAQAQSKAAGAPRAKPAAKSRPKATPKPKAGTAKTEAPSEAAAPAEAKAADATPTGESGVRAAGTTTRAPAETGKAVKEAESKEGVKTYEFGAVEVEGRLRSPQILYFLRRVRAEFDASALGHRSFLRELADTRNDAAFR